MNIGAEGGHSKVAVGSPRLNVAVSPLPEPALPRNGTQSPLPWNGTQSPHGHPDSSFPPASQTGAVPPPLPAVVDPAAVQAMHLQLSNLVTLQQHLQDQIAQLQQNLPGIDGNSPWGSGLVQRSPPPPPAGGLPLQQPTSSAPEDDASSARKQACVPQCLPLIDVAFITFAKMV